MLLFPRPAVLATLATVLGAALYAAAAGGVASVDGELRSAAPAARFQNVALQGRACPAPRPHLRPTHLNEI
ncbi:MAG TPA: hypothetical protein VF533_23400 [Solirubrobacteraceae bacterium]|jgi:hypothetical protein